MKKTLIATFLCFCASYSFGDNNISITLLSDISDYIEEIKKCNLVLNYERITYRSEMSLEDAQLATEEFYRKIMNESNGNNNWESDVQKLEQFHDLVESNSKNFMDNNVQSLTCKYEFANNTMSEFLYDKGQLVVGSTVDDNSLTQINNTRNVYENANIISNPTKRQIDKNKRWNYIGFFKWIKHFENPNGYNREIELIDEDKAKFNFGDEEKISLLFEKKEGNDRFLITEYVVNNGKEKITYTFSDYTLIENIVFPSLVKYYKEILDDEKKNIHFAPNNKVYIMND